ADLAASLGHTPPTRLTACVIDPASTDPQCRVGALHRNRLRWELPNVGGDAVTSYIAYRVTGGTVTAVNAAQKIEAGRTLNGTTFTLDDLEELPNAQPFTYWVVGRFVSDADVSSPSNYATVVAVNNNPVAVADTPSTNEDTLLTGDVLANDADADSQGRFPTLVSAPAHAATFQLNPDGTFSYLPAANFFGTDTFTYRLAAGLWPRPPVPMPVSGDSDVRTVTITINPVNDPPSFTAGAADTVLEDSGLRSVAWATAISAGPANETDGSCSVPGVGAISVCHQVVDFLVSNDNPALFAPTGQPKVAPDGTLTYTPAADANGNATVTVQAHDNGGLDLGGISTSAPQTFVVTVTPVNDVPSFTRGADQRVAKDSGPTTVLAWATGLSRGPANESAQALDFVVTTTNGTLFSAAPAISPLGTLTYTPATGAVGVALVSVALHDDGGTSNGGVDTSAVQTFTITVGATVLVYGPSLDLGTPVNEKTIAEAAGYVVTVKDAGQWTAMTKTEFAAYNAIVFGDPNCIYSPAPLSVAEGNRMTWSEAVTGPIVVIGTDATYHRAHGTASVAAAAETLTRNAIAFAASGTSTGMYMSLSCYYATVASPATVTVLEEFGTFVAGKVDRSSVVVKQPSHPVMSGLTSTLLSGWGDSVHEWFSAFPSTWTVIAVETSGSPAEQPYIITNTPPAPPLP
ncbi:MAG: Ig-like domain-containing protein, partial [Acidobacteriota bacterium]